MANPKFLRSGNDVRGRCESAGINRHRVGDESGAITSMTF